ncbi:MAG TPA: tripartite tricarboxylate transporter substrate binding protein [Xanthobacteraceae bacterium]|nr:tripartite tricarboxylate transporter substrate binding protein [Xanthobacteraceae bacterium]
MMHRGLAAASAALALIAAVAVFAPHPAAAEDYPARSVTVIVPYPAGGGVDFMGRLVAQNLSAALGQQFVVENRGGAGGMIGTRDIAHAAPDGYTIGMMLTGISLGPDPGYDVNKDFAPIGLVASTPIIVDANPSLPAKTLAEVIALAKKEPGKLAAGTPPAPTLNYFAAKLFNLMGGVDITTVAYKGTGPLTNDLLGNHVPLGFNTIPASVSQIGAGQLRGLAVAAPVRSAALPDVPTAAESGLPGFEAVQYYGVVAPAGTPQPIVDKLNAALRKMLASDDVKKRLVAAGSDPAPSTPEQYAQNITREEGKWAALVKKLGLKIEY